MWLEACERAGVVVLPREELWSPALVAADLTIGDHGSVTFYSAALGTPLMLATAPAGTVDPASPIAKLLAVAPRFDPADDPAAQIERTLADHDPAGFAPITALTTSLPGQSATVLRETIYRHLDLSVPEEPAETRALPVPEVLLPETHAQLVRVDHDGHEPTVTRFVADSLHDPEQVPPDTHLVVDTREPNARLLDLADIVLHDRPRDAVRWITETVRALPGCLIAVARVADRAWVAGTAAGLLVRLDDLTGPPLPFASVLYSCLVTGRELPRTVRVRAGGESHTANATILSPARRAEPPHRWSAG